MKVGRVKFAVKEIKIRGALDGAKMETDALQQ